MSRSRTGEWIGFWFREPVYSNGFHQLPFPSKLVQRKPPCERVLSPSARSSSPGKHSRGKITMHLHSPLVIPTAPHHAYSLDESFFYWTCFDRRSCPAQTRRDRVPATSAFKLKLPISSHVVTRERKHPLWGRQLTATPGSCSNEWLISAYYRWQRSCPWRWTKLASMSRLWTSPVSSLTNRTQKRSLWSLWRSIKGTWDDV